MEKRLADLLYFLSGIAVGSVTNTLTALDARDLALRVGAMVLFGISAYALFSAALKSESVLLRAQQDKRGMGPQEIRDRFWELFRREIAGKDLVVSALAYLVAVALLLRANFRM